MKEDKTETTKTYDTIKPGIDAHAKWYYVDRQLEGATPQPVQKMTFEALLRFVAKQQELAGDGTNWCLRVAGSDPNRSRNSIR